MYQTTAVGSLLVGSVISKIDAEHPGVYKPEHVAHTLSFLAGAALFVLGILRLGWLIEFIPYVPISAFVTSAAITIISTQLPTVLGIKGIDTRTSPYKVYISTLKGLPSMQLDAAVGITCILLLHLIRSTCAKMELRQPTKKRVWSLLSSLRLTFAILLYTLISFLVNRTAKKGEEKFRIVGHIDKGFSHAGVPKMNTKLIGLVASELPAIIIILIVEHIAIAKSFGRIFGYTVVPSQEMIAQGASNMLSPFVGGYVCTGSFGASAVLSKAAVRTPLAGLFSAMVLVLALYALTAVFFFIPNAALAGLIIHCTANLITPPRSLVKYWHFSPFEFFIWICGVVIAFFTDLETAIYVTNEETRQVYLPYDIKDNRNPSVKVEPVYPGVFVYRFAENFNYINQAHHIDHLTTYIKSQTRPTDVNDGVRPSDRLWCEKLPSTKLLEEESDLPILKAVVLDFATVNIIDITSLQGLIELRSTLDRYAAPELVEWHFAGVHNSWTRRALAHAGFGLPAGNSLGNWCPAYTVTSSFVGATEDEQRDLEALRREAEKKDKESRKTAQVVRDADSRDPNMEKKQSTLTTPGQHPALTTIYGTDRPLFHIDLHDAVDAAVRDAKRQDSKGCLVDHASCASRGDSVHTSPV
ncbi:hypothetical protein SNOG_08888 [Parastagonospora nodorum SN15]|uniref:STAS domain-containing protein n=1 Tax=Phaeosphaeria nodorum (strain SN15 / ATCC MYA-4574 / FGSC 10173) TaxID=321614 RepID=Q0UH76_PHANO|nr:hypothetical protein SNOG_08888 [Parastagonospora nodorum SN15]EAT84056.2 hypothetical protein SNOG_08888 [Parastagonospora nodorum SN15]